MGLRDSRAIKLLREQGIKPFVSHCVRKSIRILNKKICFLLLNFYPKFVLSKSQYKTFRSVYQHFEENYKNIILISPLFFMKHIKRHIIWLESQEFKNEYGGVEYLIDIHTQRISEDSVMQYGGQHAIGPTPPSIAYKINSAEGHHRYEETRQFYPPLLNPKDVDYERVCVDLAIELRLPTQNSYKFIFVRYGLSGGLAMTSFLLKSNIKECTYKQLFKNDKTASWYGKQACLYIDHLWTPDNSEVTIKILSLFLIV